jgi:hypothetical protein
MDSCQILVVGVECSAQNSGPAVAVYDRLFHCGAYAFNAATTLAAQPSYSTRVNGGDYTGCMLWYEQVTAATGAQTVVVTYTDQDGNTGITAPTFAATSAATAGFMSPMPLASGDSGVQVIESVTGTVASAGTFNISVMRPIFRFIVGASYIPQVWNYDQLGWPEIYPTSALVLLNTSQSLVERVTLELAFK